MFLTVGGLAAALLHDLEEDPHVVSLYRPRVVLDHFIGGEGGGGEEQVLVHLRRGGWRGGEMGTGGGIV